MCDFCEIVGIAEFHKSTPHSQQRNEDITNSPDSENSKEKVKICQDTAQIGSIATLIINSSQLDVMLNVKF